MPPDKTNMLECIGIYLQICIYAAPEVETCQELQSSAIQEVQLIQILPQA